MRSRQFHVASIQHVVHYPGPGQLLRSGVSLVAFPHIPGLACNEIEQEPERNRRICTHVGEVIALLPETDPATATTLLEERVRSLKQKGS